MWLLHHHLSLTAVHGCFIYKLSVFCVWWCLIWPFHRWHRRVLWVFVPSSAGSQRRSLLTTKQTKTKRPALSSLMRTCCIIYTVHVSWTHFSRTLLFLFQSWYCCYPEKNRMWLWFHTFDTDESLSVAHIEPAVITFICYWARWCVKDDRWSYNGVQMWEVMTRCMDTHCSLNPQPAFSDFPAASAGPAAAGSLLQAFYHSAMMCPEINPYLIW